MTEGLHHLVRKHRRSLAQEPLKETGESVAYLRKLNTKENNLSPYPFSYDLMEATDISSLEGLTEITVRHMLPGKRYSGRFLQLVNIEPAKGYEFEESFSDHPTPMSVSLVVRDSNKSLQRAFVYNYLYPRAQDADNEDNVAMYTYHKLRDQFPVGCHLYAIDPQIQVGIDEILTITMTNYDKLVVKTKSETKRCARCGTESIEMLHCAKCQQTNYCSRFCQVEDWYDKDGGHKKICKILLTESQTSSRRLPWSVYVLQDLIRDDLLPGLQQRSVRLDYGFNNCKTSIEESNLLGIYQDLVNYISTDIVSLHLACINGQLAEFIKHHFERLPKRVEYYAWFLKNQQVVKNPYPLSPDLQYQKILRKSYLTALTENN